MSCSSRVILCLLFCIEPALGGAIRSKDARIVKVLDANCFMLYDGRRITLACIQAPSVHDGDANLSRFANYVKYRAAKVVLNERVEIVFGPSDASDEALPVHVFPKSFPAGKSLNRFYLENGFGFFRSDCNSCDRAAYANAAGNALRNRAGIWNQGLFQPKRTGMRSTVPSQPGPPENTDRCTIFSAGFFRTASRQSKKDVTYPLMAVRRRWSFIRQIERPKIGFMWELAFDAPLIPSIQAGIEFRPIRNLRFAAGAGSYVFFIHGSKNRVGADVDWTNGFFGEGRASMFLLEGKSVRLELEGGLRLFFADPRQHASVFAGTGIGIR